MVMYYKKIFKFLISFDKNYFLKILFNVFIFIGLLFATYDFNYYQHNHINYTTEINDNDENTSIPSFYKFDIYNLFENIEKDISNKNFKKDDFKYNYSKFIHKEEKNSLPFIDYHVQGDTFLFTDNNSYIIKDEHNILSMAEINDLKNKFYYDFEKIIEKEYKGYSTLSVVNDFGELLYNSEPYEKQEINFYNEYDGLHYSVLTQKNKIEIQFYTDKKRDFNSLQKIIILEPNKIYFENNKSFAYNKIKYNKNVDQLNLKINKDLHSYLLLTSFYILLFLFIINQIPFILKKITLFLYKNNKNQFNNSLDKKNSRVVISEGFLFLGFISLLYFIFIFYNQLNSINSFNDKKFSDYFYYNAETTSKKELFYFIQQIDNIKNNKENMFVNNDHASIFKLISNNSHAGFFIRDDTAYFHSTEYSFSLFNNNDSTFVKNKNNEVLLAQFNQEKINRFNEIQYLKTGIFTIDNKFYNIVVSRDDFTRIEIFYDYYIYDGDISFDKKESYIVDNGIVTYYNTDITEVNNNPFHKNKKLNNKEDYYTTFNNLFASFILLTLILSYRRKVFFRPNKKTIVELINIDNKITIEKQIS